MPDKKFILDPAHDRCEIIRSNAMRYIRQLELDRPMEIIIQPFKDSLSKQQRGGFHWLCQVLGDRLGYTAGEIKEMVKRDMYGTKIVTVAGHMFEVTESSEYDSEGKKRKTDDYARLIDGIYRLAAEAGEVLPMLDKWRKAG